MKTILTQILAGATTLSLGTGGILNNTSMCRAALALLVVCLMPLQAIGGTWTSLAHTAPSASGGVMLLLSDGTVMCKSSSGGGDSSGNLWNKLTPDSTGSYANGTWTTLAPMADTRLYFSSQVLKDGRVFVAGGEYGTGGAKGETYNPVTNTWTSAPAQGSIISDANSELLPDGRVLVALVTGTLRSTIIFDPVANTWTAGPTANGIHNESAWVKLPDGSSLMVDRLSTNSERYIPSTNTWVVDATVPVQLYDAFGDETGPGFLLPDGRAFFIGSPSNTAYYTPSGTNAAGTWAAGPTIPGAQGAPDAAGAMMRDGKILCALSPTPTSANHFPSPTTFYEFDYTTNGFTAVTAPGGGSNVNISSYITNMLVLPDGNVLYCQQGATQYYLYTPGAALAAGKPTVTTINQNGDGSYHLTGTKLNGISQGAAYGDDWQMATNYPIVRLTSGSSVYYARTYNWSSVGVMTGNTPVTTDFIAPATLPAGTYSLVAIANGIASDPVSFSYAPVAPTVTSPTQTNILATSVTLGGNVTSDGGGAIIERGVVYSVTSANSNPTIGGSGVTKVISTGTTGIFTANVTGLVQSTAYSFKAYATNVAGTTYTTPVSTFTTLAGFAPTVTTPTQATITQVGATLGGNITSDGNAPIIERGVVYSITTANSNPLISGTGVTKVTSVGTTGVFTISASGLTQGTGYSFKAYAINSIGTTYTTPVSTFTTLTAVPLTGTKTVGTGGNYTSLTNAGGLFEVINNNGVNGALIVQITSNLTAETGAVALNAMSGTTPSASIFPTGAARVINGSIAGALIRLNGADNVTLDGSVGGTGTDRSLTITNTSTTSSTVIALMSLGTGLGTTNDVIRNCNISTGVATSIGYGISVGGSTPGTNGADNDNVTIQNNSLTAAPVGIYAFGTASASTGGDDNLQIIGNSIAYNSTLASIGIQVGNALNSSVSQNTVSEQTSNLQAPTAISIETGFVSSSVTRNIITQSLTTNSGGYGGRGITVGTGTATSTLTIANNMIYGVNGTNWSDFTNSSAMGIAIGTIGNSSTLTTVAGGINLYHNSVSMTGSMGTASTLNLTAAIYIGSGASALNIRNNVFANTQVGTSTTQKNYAIYSAATSAAFTTMDYNDYYVSNTFNAASAIPGFLTSDRTNLAGIQSGFGQNTHSLTGDPLFTSATDLHITSLVSPASNVGTAIAGTTTDFDGDTRSASTPDIGADEFASPPLVSNPTQTAITATSATLGGNVTSDGGAAITERGVVYAITTTNANPLIGGTGVSKLTSTGTTGSFTVNATGLASVTGYSFKAYAINSTGTTYTTPVSTFTTLALPPTVTTPTQASITSSTATLGGNVTSNGGAAITERGVVYAITATNSNPQINGTGVTKLTSAGTTGVFTVNATGLSAGTGYTFNAYATNNMGTTYTTPVSTFTTLTVLNNWRLTFYGTTSNTGNAADTADPYHTGVPNLAVLGLLGPLQDPAKAHSSLLPQPQKIGGNYLITFTQPAGVSGVTYGAEWITDLTSGIWTSMTDTGSGATHTFSLPIGNNPKLFFRLKVSSP